MPSVYFATTSNTDRCPRLQTELHLSVLDSRHEGALYQLISNFGNGLLMTAQSSTGTDEHVRRIASTLATNVDKLAQDRTPRAAFNRPIPFAAEGRRRTVFGFRGTSPSDVAETH